METKIIYDSSINQNLIKDLKVSVIGFGKFTVLTGTKLKLPLFIFVKENNGFHIVKLKFPLTAWLLMLSISIYPWVAI